MGGKRQVLVCFQTSSVSWYTQQAIQNHLFVVLGIFTCHGEPLF